MKIPRLVTLRRRSSGEPACKLRGEITVAVRPPNRSRLTPRWPTLRRLFGKSSAASAGNTATGRVIHDYFHRKAHTQGYTLSHSQLRVIDCMAQHAAALSGTSAKTCIVPPRHPAAGHFQLPTGRTAAQPAVPRALQTGDRPDQRTHAGHGGRGPHDYRSQVRTHAQQLFTQGQYVWPATLAQRQSLNLPERDAPANSASSTWSTSCTTGTST
ncbi:hypothetical protein PS943_02159 [Pseudomonas fluorescens]|uniref:Uncharacterized protein n=1 Tax=Pseudomonas fluorescens TaxID=294 RepID=A0A5E7W7Q6_PSEFL|nr:hypothetical protein PS943_02159 [Pseudomonas fluorescens]